MLWDLDETLLPTEPLREARHGAPIDLRRHPSWEEIHLHDGISEAFSRLERVPIGVVTSSPRWYVQQILDAHLPGTELAVVVTYDDVGDLKPHPESLLLAASRWRVRPQACIYIGDDLVDHQACRAADVAFFGAGWAHSPTYPAAGVAALEDPREVADVVFGQRP